ncbi:MAG: ABC transporter permease [Planctomycetes bacterium]|nr:ABC transporter permease [Planctomycetota bacterium]
MERLLAPVDALGRATIALTSYLVEIATAVALSVRHLVLPARGGRRVAGDVLARQVYFTGVEAVPFVLLLAGLTATALVAQVQVQASGLGTGLGPLIVTLLLRELGPLLTALVVIGRSGTAIATELANMRVAGEIDGLAYAGVDPFRYLVVPRLAGMAVAMVCLTLVWVAAAVVAGFALARLWLGTAAPPWGAYAESLALALDLTDPLVLLAKTLIPGLVVAAIACREGLACDEAVTGVPRAASRAVVRSITAVVVWDVLVTLVAVT